MKVAAAGGLSWGLGPPAAANGFSSGGTMRSLRRRFVVRSGTPADAGAAAVELALVLPLFVVLIFGAISFGRAYTNSIQLAGAAREGARTMAVKEDEAAARQSAKDSYAALTDADITFVYSTGDSTCPPDTYVTVTTTHSDFELDFLLFTLDRDLHGTGAMRCGG